MAVDSFGEAGHDAFAPVRWLDPRYVVDGGFLVLARLRLWGTDAQRSEDTFGEVKLVRGVVVGGGRYRVVVVLLLR